MSVIPGITRIMIIRASRRRLFSGLSIASIGHNSVILRPFGILAGKTEVSCIRLSGCCPTARYMMLAARCSPRTFTRQRPGTTWQGGYGRKCPEIIPPSEDIYCFRCQPGRKCSVGLGTFAHLRSRRAARDVLMGNDMKTILIESGETKSEVGPRPSPS
jgi:hypothetical protein